MWLLRHLLLVAGSSMAAQSPLLNMDSRTSLYDRLAVGEEGGYDGSTGTLPVQASNNEENLNSVLDLLVGQQNSPSRNRIHSAISHGHGRSHRSGQHIPDVVDLITMSERDVFNDDGAERHWHRRRAPVHHHHHRSRREYDEDVNEDDRGNEEFIQYPSSTRRGHHQGNHPSHHTAHHKPDHHRLHHHHLHPQRESKGPSQIADVIEELEVAEDGSTAADAPEPRRPNPHLRDKLLHRVKPRPMETVHESYKSHSHRHHTHRHHAADEPAPAHDANSPARVQDDDDLPLDEFGLKKDCHWIQMDFSQHSDNCNQCMTVADAYFRGDDICVCYKNKPGAPMRTKCNEMLTKFKGDEDHIRELAVERQWNEYYKSYGLCEAYSHCGSV